MKLARLAGLMILFGGVAACSDLGTDPKPANSIESMAPGPTVSFADDLQPVFAANCSGCHGLNGGLSLETGGAWANLVNTTSVGYGPALRVVPGNPDESVLYGKLTDSGAYGGMMPPPGALDAATLEKFRAWIAEGALDN